MTHTRARLTIVSAATLSLVGLSAVTGVTPSAQSSPPDVAAVSATAAAAEPADAAAPAADADAIARAHVARHHDELGLSSADAAAMTVSSQVPLGSGGSVVYLQQRLADLDVHGAMLSVAIDPDGTVVSVASSAVEGAAKRAGGGTTPSLSAVAAARAAAETLGLDVTGSLAAQGRAVGTERARTLGDGGISASPIPARLVYAPTEDGELRLAWELVIEQLDAEHWWQVRMDADSGALLGKDDWVSPDSYVVYPLPTEAPSFGGRSTQVNPATAAGSPFGWHDTNGVAGADFTDTRGNNVDAYADVDANNVPDPGSRPDGGAPLAFNFPLDLGLEPSTYKAATVTNLFYLSNRIHDTFYRYGFTEAAGNFQVDNYGRGGAGGDAVNAEAQDGAGTNNANFATPPDGSAPRMQMFVWNMSSPQRDGSLDAGIVVHEYGHGISTRLTGGPATSSCLSNAENGGEGWSDWFGLMLTMPSGTEPAGGKGIGTYALNQPTDGPGIRTQKYSTDPAVNTFTYDSTKTLVAPHGTGSVWAQMLWEVTWALIAEDGFAPDLVNGTGGNTLALQLVMDGLKLQPCNPGFVDARDAIITADELATGGENACTLWTAFAKRGLGAGALQGSTSSNVDGTEAFDLPDECLPAAVTATATPDPVGGGNEITYDLDLANGTDSPTTGVVVTSALGAGSTYVPGSATCGGVYDSVARRVTFPARTLASGATQRCSLRATADEAPVSTVELFDDFTAGLAGWSASHASGTTDWGLTTTTPASPPQAAFVAGTSVVGDRFLTLAAPQVVPPDGQLSFQHSYALENTFDGGVVEISDDAGATWEDLGPAFIENGYTGTISASFGSPIPGRQAFTGTTSDVYKTSVVDISAFAGQSVLIRFRQASDSSVTSTGWWVDDVSITREVAVENTMTIDSDRTDPAVRTVLTRVVAAPPDSPLVAASVPTSATTTSVALTPRGTGGSPVTGFAVECVSLDGGATRSATGATGLLSVSGLSAGKRYHCHASATNALGTGDVGAFGPTYLQAVAPSAPTVKKQKPVGKRSLKVFVKSGASGGSKVTSYVAQCVPKGGGKKRTAQGTGNKITVKKLSAGKRYHCRAKAKNAVGSSPYGAFGPYVKVKK